MKNILKHSKKLLALYLVVIMLLPMTVGGASAAFTFDESLLYADRTVTKVTTYRVTKGVTEINLVLNDASGNNQVKCYALDIDLSNPDLSVVAGYANADASTWDRATVRDQATAYEEKYNTNVVGGINGDFYNTSTGEPVGFFVMNGETFHHDAGRPYFAILNDGTAVIRESWDSKDDIKEAVGGSRILIKDGVPVTDGRINGTAYPRAAVGIKADGSVVFFVADGRQTPDSCGMPNDDDLAAALHSLGCVDAINLDGGGSSMLAGERECLSGLTVRSTPSYAGIERPIANSLLVCTASESTGVFDHLSFTSDVIEIHPGDTTIIRFAACDENGYRVDIPDGKLVLEDESCGKLLGAIFKASETEGRTKLNYVVDGEIIGSVEVNISLDNLSNSQRLGGIFGQLIVNVFNLFITLVEKVGEKTGWY